MTTFKKGDPVWFVSKFNDVVTGTYEGDTEVPAINGTAKMHRVISYNAFGKPSKEPTNCLVLFGALNPGSPKEST